MRFVFLIHPADPLTPPPHTLITNLPRTDVSNKRERERKITTTLNTPLCNTHTRTSITITTINCDMKQNERKRETQRVKEKHKVCVFVVNDSGQYFSRLRNDTHNFKFSCDFLFLCFIFILFVILHPVAQIVKHYTCNGKVMGSIPYYFR